MEDKQEVINKELNQILVGYYHYYGITDNSEALGNFYFWIRRGLLYWLNLRSKKVIIERLLT